jgi:hypothetical protein
MEYPHFGIAYLSDCAIQKRNGDLYGFPYQGQFLKEVD